MNPVNDSVCSVLYFHEVHVHITNLLVHKVSLAPSLHLTQSASIACISIMLYTFLIIRLTW